MENPKVLSGYEIVARGVTKTDASLPELGLKDVTPNGSWLEQKQIQASLEARKHLIEVERIEKRGTLSQATWIDNLQLAVVKQQTGSYWQYLGHHAGKNNYLFPEEALFLMEVNCLLLKHNDVTVSLQKAYSLLLNENITTTQYKVYASLSRLGYKVFRHKSLKPYKEKEKNSEELKKTELVIDTKDQVDIIEQLSSDSSVELIENSTDNIKDTVENIPLPPKPLSTELIIDSIPLPFPKPNDSASKSSETEEVEKSNPLSDENKEINPSVMDVEENEANKISDTNDKEILSNTENGQEAKAQDSVDDKLNNESSTTVKETENNTTEDVMEIDESNRTGTCSPSSTATGHTVSVVSSVNNNTKSTETSHYTPDLPDSCVASEEESNCEENESGFDATDIDDDTADSSVLMDSDAPKKEDSNHNITPIEKSSRRVKKALSNALVLKRNLIFQGYVDKLKSLTSRQSKPCDYKTLEKNFEIVPDTYKKQIFTVSVPKKTNIPESISVSRYSYVLNLNEIQKRSSRSVSVETPSSVTSNETRGNRLRLRSTSTTENPILTIPPVIRIPPRPMFRPHHFYGPCHNRPFYQYHMFFQRPVLPNMQFNPRIPPPGYPPRPHPFLRPFYPHYYNPYNPYLNPNNPSINRHNANVNTSTNNDRKRKRDVKALHLQSVKNLAIRLKQLFKNGTPRIQNVIALRRLLHTYNDKYKEKLILNADCDVVNGASIVETIELDDESESKSKKRRVDNGDMYNENLESLKQLALRLKILKAKDQVTSKHKRALSKAIKGFNTSYEADIFMNDNFEIIDNRFISIDSDSDVDCVIDEPEQVTNKKLRNPFNILKRRSEKRARAVPSTSKEGNAAESSTNDDNIDLNNESNDISKFFNTNWLPSNDDFGRAEIVPKKQMDSRFIDATKENYIFNFMKSHFDEFNNWFEAKIAFLQYLEETDFAYHNVPIELFPCESARHTGLRPLIDSEDDSDKLQKLRIIKNNKEIASDTKLRIHFDVYHRDVQNFRKKEPPKPHLRIICLEESARLPPFSEINALFSQYEDNVAIVFAIVGLSTISYLQINPIDLPMYIARNYLD